MTDRSPAADGLVVVDKPAGWTSHDVVARTRRLAATRRVGHAGTLDPMATGVLVLGIGKATRLLGHLAMTDKSYDATIRLGVTTITDDAEGDVVSVTPAGQVTDEAVFVFELISEGRARPRALVIFALVIETCPIDVGKIGEWKIEVAECGRVASRLLY